MEDNKYLLMHRRENLIYTTLIIETNSMVIRMILFILNFILNFHLIYNINILNFYALNKAFLIISYIFYKLIKINKINMK